MKNFINVRVQSYNHTKQLNILKHNLRKIKSLSEGAFNDVVGTSKHTSNFIIQKDGSLFELENKDFINLSYDFIVDEYKKDRKLHNEKMYARKQRNLLNEQATWVEGVFTFSEAIKQDLNNKYSLEELSKVANSCAKELASKINTELKYLVVHLDETTPHFHFAMKNFDDDGMSIFHKIKHKEILAKIQDLAFKHFGELGMDRGISKEVTGKNYQNIRNYYKQQEIEVRAIIQSLQSDIKQIQEAKKDIKNNFDLTSAEKKQELDKLDLEIKSLRNTMNEYKTIKNDNDIKLKAQQDEISAANDTLNDLNAKINIKEQEVNSFKDVIVKNKDIINNLINNNITKNIVKQDVVINLDELKKDVNNLVNKTLKINIKSKELEEKDEQIKKLEDKNSILLDKLNEERSKNKVLEQKEGQTLQQNKKALQIMDKQQKALIRETRRNQRRTNQRNKYFQTLMRDNNLTRAMQTRKFLRDNKTRDINKNKIKKTIEENYDLSR